jgi:FkbM family methyltransferase
MAERTGTAGLVWAIEASKSSAEKLKAVVETLSLNQVIMIRKAVSNCNRQVTFADDEASSEANAIQSDSSVEHKKSIKVSAVSLEELLASNPSRSPSLIKLDIEGAEPLAFRGWASLAATPDPPLLVFEVYPRGLARLGFNAADIFAALPLQRYRFWHLNVSYPNSWPEFPRGIPFRLVNPFSHPWPMHSNVIAVPVDGMFADRASELRDILP